MSNNTPIHALMDMPRTAHPARDVARDHESFRNQQKEELVSYPRPVARDPTLRPTQDQDREQGPADTLKSDHWKGETRSRNSCRTSVV